MKRGALKLLLVLMLVVMTVTTFVACGGINVNITFMVEGEEYGTVKASVASVVTMAFPSDPTKEDYAFDGWYWDEGTWQQPFTANSILDKPISENMSFNVYAKFRRSSPYNVVFKVGTTTHHTLNTLGMEEITLPVEPEKSGFDFSGWETEDGQPFDRNSLLNVELDSDIEVFATWIEKYTITYVTSNGATHTNPTSYLNGSTLKLSQPIYNGSSEGMWLDEDGEIVTALPIDGEYRDVTLTASKISIVKIGATNNGYGVEWLRKTVEEFNAMQDEYEVVLNDCDSPNFDAKGEQELSNPATAPNDVYLISEIWWVNNAKNLYFEPLDDVYSAPFNDEMTIAEAMRPENIAQAKVNDINGEDHYYAFNYASTASGLVYNKTIADYYEGLYNWGSTPKIADIKNGGTVDQLIQWMDKISELSKTNYNFNNGKYLDGVTSINTRGGTQPAVYPMVYAGQRSYWDAVLNTWWAQAAGVDGYRRFFEYSDVSIYSDNARLRALKAMEKLRINERSVPGSVSMDHIVSQDEFLKGRAVIIPCGDWMYYEMKQNASNWNVDFQMIYVPACDSAVPAENKNILSYSDGGLCVIPSGDLNPNANVEGAKAFLKYLFSENGCRNFTMETGSMWGFDGTEDPDTTYATAIAEGDIGNGMSIFNLGTYNLIVNANGYVTNLPLDLDAPNVAFGTTSGVGGAWPSIDLSKLRQYNGAGYGESAQSLFNKCVSYVTSEWPRWVEKVYLYNYR